MSDATPSLPVSWRESFVSTLRSIESTVSVLFIFVFFCVMILAILPFVFYVEGIPLVRAGLLAMLVIEYRFVYWVKKSLEAGHRPIAVYLACHQPRWWLPARPIVAAWWLGRFVLAGVIGAVIVHAMWTLEDVPLWGRVVAQVGIFTAICSSNCYLLLAIFALVRRRDAVEFVWRWRIAIDLLVLAGAWLVAPTVLKGLDALP